METKKTLRETDDFLHCEAFSWCKGVEEEQEEEQEMISDKALAIVSILFFIAIIVIATYLNKRFGIVFE